MTYRAECYGGGPLDGSVFYRDKLSETIAAPFGHTKDGMPLAALYELHGSPWEGYHYCMVAIIEGRPE